MTGGLEDAAQFGTAFRIGFDQYGAHGDTCPPMFQTRGGVQSYSPGWSAAPQFLLVRGSVPHWVAHEEPGRSGQVGSMRTRVARLSDLPERAGWLVELGD